jgi:hypothetical protein
MNVVPRPEEIPNEYNAIDPTPPPPIANLGFSCYANAIFQMIYSILPIRNMLLKADLVDDVTTPTLLKQYMYLMTQGLTEKKSKYKEQVESNYPYGFTCGIQDDANLMLSEVLLTYLEPQHIQIIDTKYRTSKEGETATHIELKKGTPQAYLYKYLKVNLEVIDDMKKLIGFNEIVQSWCPGNENKINAVKERYYPTLNLPIDGTKPIETLIQKYTEVKSLEDIKETCSKKTELTEDEKDKHLKKICNNRTDLTEEQKATYVKEETKKIIYKYAEMNERSNLLNFRPFLIVVLMRITDGKKAIQQIKAPLHLNIGESDNLKKFKLRGFVHHSGNELKEGHYTYYKRVLPGNTWMKADDATIIKDVTLNQISTVIYQSYIYLYQSTDEDETKEEKKIEKEIEEEIKEEEKKKKKHEPKPKMAIQSRERLNTIQTRERLKRPSQEMESINQIMSSNSKCYLNKYRPCSAKSRALNRYQRDELLELAKSCGIPNYERYSTNQLCTILADNTAHALENQYLIQRGFLAPRYFKLNLVTLSAQIKSLELDPYNWPLIQETLSDLLPLPKQFPYIELVGSISKYLFPSTLVVILKTKIDAINQVLDKLQNLQPTSNLPNNFLRNSQCQVGYRILAYRQLLQMTPLEIWTNFCDRALAIVNYVERNYASASSLYKPDVKEPEELEGPDVDFTEEPQEPEELEGPEEPKEPEEPEELEGPEEPKEPEELEGPEELKGPEEPKEPEKLKEIFECQGEEPLCLIHAINNVMQNSSYMTKDKFENMIEIYIKEKQDKLRKTNEKRLEVHKKYMQDYTDETIKTEYNKILEKYIENEEIKEYNEIIEKIKKSNDNANNLKQLIDVQATREIYKSAVVTDQGYDLLLLKLALIPKGLSTKKIKSLRKPTNETKIKKHLKDGKYLILLRAIIDPADVKKVIAPAHYISYTNGKFYDSMNKKKKSTANLEGINLNRDVDIIEIIPILEESQPQKSQEVIHLTSDDEEDFF